MKNLVVIGAGSAGWLAALYAKKWFFDCNITVIGSTEIGIIGAGEGTTPLICGFLHALNIKQEDIIKNCKATQKLGIRFIDWSDKKTFNNVNNTDYIHGFKLNSIIPRTSYTDHFNHLSEMADITAVLSNKRINDYSIDGICCDEKLSSFLKDGLSGQSHVAHALHFDANLLAGYLKTIGQMRGISYIDDVVEDFKLEENGNIKSIVCRNKTIDCDFVFDCSGFKRVVIGNLYKTKWIDLQERLPVNRAIPFFLPPEEQYENYTTAIAMNSGWCWKIPLQHRSGCGYVFDSSTCDENAAIQELEKKYKKVDIIRSISFNAGFYEKSWVKNCISFGLSSGFVEPLEATSLMITMSTLYESMKYLTNDMHNQYFIDSYNDYYLRMWNDVADFIQFHYLNKRDDTEFWRRVNAASRSDSLSRILECSQKTTPAFFQREFTSPTAKNKPVFDSISWLRVGLGINVFPKSMLEAYARNVEKYCAPNHLEETKNIVYKLKNKHKSHQDYLITVVGKDTLMQHRSSIFNV